jgi:SPP1 family predicted phage head-tail adaptor
MMPEYTATDLRHWIELLKLIKVPDGGGGTFEQWSPLSPPAKLPALVRPRSSGERFRTGQTASSELYMVVIRYRNNIDSKMRIAYGNRIFEIVGIVDLEERHEWMEIDAELTQA